ncbi:hypothetical protein ACK2MR_10165 [Providencia hangzhouensis]|uniref:hypothetical protein n=1 Tax=Providencia TaxID=586 RepID=UPI00235E81BB|nr:hypothetical protein [Providencia rettgeri]
MNGIFTAVYWVLNIIQVIAVIAGFHEWLGWNIVISIILAAIIGWFPLIGTFMGVMGAVEGWGWEYWQAILLFIWPLILVFFFGALSTVTDKFSRN